MSIIISTTRGGTCCICQDDFNSQDQQITHTGGEGHDGFHEKCLKKWLTRSPTCPYDHQSINPNSLITKTEQVVGNLRSAFSHSKSALIHASYVASAITGLVAVDALMKIVGGPTRLETLSSLVGTATILGGVTTQIGELDQSIIVGGTAILSAAIASGIGAEVGAFLGASGAVLGVAGGSKKVQKIALGVLVGSSMIGIEGVAVGSSKVLAGVSTGIGINSILNRIVLNPSERINIQLGIVTTGFAATFSPLIAHVVTPLTMTVGTALAASVAVGILSLL
jgi:hypothetical protein